MHKNLNIHIFIQDKLLVEIVIINYFRTYYTIIALRTAYTFSNIVTVKNYILLDTDEHANSANLYFLNWLIEVELNTWIVHSGAKIHYHLTVMTQL